MSAIGLLSLGLFSTVVGVLIGCVGIGGVLLVPVLTYIGNVDIHIAIAAAMFGYIFSGAIGTLAYARQRSINWRMALWLFAGSIPAAFAGAWASSIVSATALELIIAVLIVFAGINALRPNRVGAQSREGLSGTSLTAIGAISGFGSALTGTGGPLILVPLLVSLELPVLMAIGLSQVIQLPIASLATAGNFIYGQVNIALGSTIAVAIAGGALLGARLAHAVSQRLLRQVVAWLLVVVGSAMVAKNLYLWTSALP